jgi:hypothetical protein
MLLLIHHGEPPWILGIPTGDFLSGLEILLEAYSMICLSLSLSLSLSSFIFVI